MTIDGHEVVVAPPAGEVGWDRRWEAGIVGALRGNEERQSRRLQGLQAIEWECLTLTLEERASLEAAIKAALESGKACGPFWGRSAVVATAAAASATTLTLEDNLWGFAEDDYVALIDQAERTWEARRITGVAGTTLTLDAGIAAAQAAGALVWPLMYGKLICSSASAIENHRCVFQLRLEENDPARAKAAGASAPAEYLGRPVAPIAIDWGGPVKRSFKYNLGEFTLGFGASDYEALANCVARGAEFEALLEGMEAICEWDNFTAARAGQAGGFWIRDSVCIFEITSAPAADTLQARTARLNQTWADDPAVYVVFEKEGEASQYAAIEEVDFIGGGLEEVTLDASLTLDATWEAYRLRYVRLAGDEETGRFPVEHRQWRSVRVVELPEEYVAAESAAAPVWLYRFWMENAGVTIFQWRYTSHEAAVVSDGETFASANINHGALTRSLRGEREKLEIKTGLLAPLARFFPFRIGLPVWVEVLEATAAAPDAAEIIFRGMVSGVAMQGKRITAACDSALDALGAAAPGLLIGRVCGVRLFGTGCNLNKATYAKAATISAVSGDGRTVTVTGVSGSLADDWFALGWLEAGSGEEFQIATIRGSTALGGGSHELRLSWALQFAGGGDAVTIYPGCDGQYGTCGTKFSNQVNFRGHPYMPVNNPSLPPMESAFRTGSKK